MFALCLLNILIVFPHNLELNADHEEYEHKQ